MSQSLTQFKVRRSVRILDKQITRKSLKDIRAQTLKTKKTKAHDPKIYINPPSFQEIVHQISHSKQEYFSQLMLALRFMKNLAPVDHKDLVTKSVHLRKRPLFTHAKTIIFDLDETLVHCCQNPEDGEKRLIIDLPSGEKLEIGINIRPYAIECLTTLSKKFEIAVFTASHKCYADVVLDMLDPSHEIIHHRLYRENCVVVDGVFIKDLRVITNRNIEDMVIVDNSAYCFAYQLENGIPIVSWYNDTEDTELINLTQYLSTITDSKDVRINNRATFHLEQLSSNSAKILEQL